MYIESPEDLAAFAERAKGSSVLAIDTEFLREKTYYAKLCLLQMATDDEVVIVDPFSCGSLDVLAPILQDESTVKLFHAGRQDLEIIYHELGILPKPIFDTQIAAALLGHTQQIGYGPLVHAVCGVKIKKADSFTDWSRRPLTDSQINYAAEDVIYLPELYRKMTDMLEKKGRLSWLADDFAELSNPERYEMDERMRYRKLKHVSQLSRKQMAAAREMAAWRERQARRRNLPRRWVLTDEQIVEACKREPVRIDDLFMVRGMRERLNTRDARAVLALMREAMDAPEDTWPQLPTSHRNERNVDAEVDAMLAIVRVRSRENDIAMPTLASRDDLVSIARGHTEDVEVLRGWRRELIGDELMDFLAGRVTLAVEHGELSIVHF